MDLRQQDLVKAHFDQLFRSGVTPWKAHQLEPLFAEFAKILEKDHPKGRVLDLGCGDGWICLRLAKLGFRVWGIDSSETAIEKARGDARTEDVDVDFRIGDALDLPYDDNFFDGMVDRGLLHHILPENRPLYMKNVLRVLKKGALVYLTVFSLRNPEGIGQRFTRKLAEDLFAENFNIIKYKDDPWPTEAPAHLLHFILERKS